jgi:hemerythrin-like metal-binding protein
MNTTAAPSLSWSQDLALGHAVLDQTHQEFIDLLGLAETADDASLIVRLQALFEHTVEHFAMEDDWMKASDFGPQHCHGTQHQVVIQTLQELLRRAREEGDLGLTREILPELGKWFAQHAQTMDAVLTWHLDQVGFDPLTGQMSRAPTASPTPSGEAAACGPASCSS